MTGLVPEITTKVKRSISDFWRVIPGLFTHSTRLAAPSKGSLPPAHRAAEGVAWRDPDGGRLVCGCENPPLLACQHGRNRGNSRRPLPLADLQEWGFRRLFNRHGEHPPAGRSGCVIFPRTVTPALLKEGFTPLPHEPRLNPNRNRLCRESQSAERCTDSKQPLPANGPSGDRSKRWPEAFEGLPVLHAATPLPNPIAGLASNHLLSAHPL